jgi:hypothetical protein
LVAKSDLLFWIVREHGGERSVFLQAANAAIFAMMHSAIAGHEGGKPIEIHELDAKMTRKIPKRMIGRVLQLTEASSSKRSRDLHKKSLSLFLVGIVPSVAYVQRPREKHACTDGLGNCTIADARGML